MDFSISKLGEMMKKQRGFNFDQLTLLVALVFSFLSISLAESLYGNSSDSLSLRAGERIDWQVLGEGIARCASSNYFIDGTIGQTAVDRDTSNCHVLNHGFWQSFKSSVCGDANNDRVVDIGDIVYIINYIFYQGSTPIGFSDVNNDCIVDIGDIVFLINYVFYSGPELSCQ